MKCINKWMALLLCICIGCSFTGCKSETIPQEYQIYDSSYQYGITKNAPLTSSNLFSENLCIAKDENIHNDEVDSQVAKSAAVFNTTTLETLYAQNIYEKIYPASTTKILTALCAIKYGDLDQVITVSENACDMASDSSVCKLKPGDQLTLRQLLYGLLLRSGNDAAIAIAEGISGDVASFAKLMNKEANSLGATHSNFVNPNGLQDKNHYTCAYDMYLIFHAADAVEEKENIKNSSNYGS